MSLVIDGGGPKGDVLGVAELAGVMGGKRTSDLIPLCHPLALTDLVVAVTPDRAAGVLRVRAEAATTGPTGVEMEALTAACVAALTIYDMVKGVERGVEIRSVRLISKTGGKSGEWHRPPDDAVRGGPDRPKRPGARTARAHRRIEASRTGRMSEGAAGGRSALVLTASDRSAAGTREDASGDALSQRLEGARVRGRTGGRRRRPGGRSRRRSGRGGSPRADRHDRRHRPDAPRRDAPGDARRRRLRGAGPRRGDARGGPGEDAVRRPSAGPSSASADGP